VGVVAAGSWVKRRIIPTLQALEGVKLVAVANRRRHTAEQAALEFGIPTVFDDWRMLVEADDIDAVYIGGWPFLHERVTLAALDAGKHVLVEAHMANNAHEARRMLDKANVNPHLVAQVVTVGRLMKAERTIQELLAGGYLGDLSAIEVNVTEGLTDLDCPLPRRFDRNLSGNNYLYVGVWYEELMRWVGEATKVMAMAKTCYPIRRDEEGDVVMMSMPDHLGILVDFACGAQATMRFSAVAEFAPPSGLWLFGSKGTLHFDQQSQRLYGAQRGETGLREIDIPSEKQGRWRVTENWIAAIRGKEAIEYITFVDGLKYMAFVDAVAQSAGTGQVVAVPRLPTGLV
jgi:predicted dehydrogenase